MLQFNNVVCTATVKFTSRLWWRLSASLTTNAAVSNTASKLQPVTENKKNTTSKPLKDFNVLKKKLCNFLHMKSMDIIEVQKAENVEEVRQVTNTSLLSTEDKEKINKMINIWVKNNNTEKSISSSEHRSNKISENKKDNFNIDLMYRPIATAQIIQEILKMAHKEIRDISALKYSFNSILRYNNKLHPKQCRSLMFTMSKLHYSDERLLDKISNDLIMSKSELISYVPSFCKTMSEIRYKNYDFLNYMCNQILRFDYGISNGQIIEVLHSLAKLGYDSQILTKILDKYMPHLIEINDHYKFLKLVWSLTLFNKANSESVRKIFNENFIRSLECEGIINDTHKLKLLNINAYAKYMLKGYSGPFLSDIVEPVSNKRTKQKKLYIEILERTLKNILPSPSCFRMNVNTNMGFLIDAELYFDSNSTPVPVDNIEDHHKKIAIMMLDYYDLTLASSDPLGLCKLYTRLLRACKYDVISIPYFQFGIEDKMEMHVLYLKGLLWDENNVVIK